MPPYRACPTTGLSRGKSSRPIHVYYVDGEPAGLINCFEAFSTFKCKPLVNIHDVVVEKNFRGLGVSQLMLAKVEERAKEKGCCKVTLEVLESNKVAQNSYMKFGYDGYELDPKMGKALFWQKLI
jgi:ribosomal protein S18 acetylase RimI-like enzyme